MHTEAVVVTSITITLHTCRHAKIWPDHSQIASSGPALALYRDAALPFGL